jgi:hypothetical protein
MSGLFIDMAGLLAALSRGEFYLSIEQFSADCPLRRAYAGTQSSKTPSARKRDIEIDHSASEVAARASARLVVEQQAMAAAAFCPIARPLWYAT